MGASRQSVALLGMNLLEVPNRLGLVATIVIGVTCAVGTLVSMLAMGAGAHRQAMGDVRADRVVLRSIGAHSAVESAIPKDAAYSVRDLPGIRRTANGNPIAVFESLVNIEARRKATGARINFPVLAVSPGLIDLRPEFRITSGRMFQSGLHEIVASNLCNQQYVGFDLGDKPSIRGSDWIVVGHFDQGRSRLSCMVYGDADTFSQSFGLVTYNEITVMLESAATYGNFLAALRANPTLHIDAKHESEVVAEDFRAIYEILNFTSYSIGTIMALGATLGVMNSLFAMVDTRRRELATLRAIGFGSGTIVASILAESMLLALPGALMGGAMAWVLFNGFSASPFGFSFELAVTPSITLLGIGWALGMGLLGGSMPALRAVRTSVTSALRT